MFNPNFMQMPQFQMPTMQGLQQPSLAQAFDPHAFLQQMQQQQAAQWAQRPMPVLFGGSQPVQQQAAPTYASALKSILGRMYGTPYDPWAQ